MKIEHIEDSNYVFQDIVTTLILGLPLEVKKVAYKYSYSENTIHKMLRRFRYNNESIYPKSVLIKKGVGVYVLILKRE